MIEYDRMWYNLTEYDKHRQNITKDDRIWQNVPHNVTMRLHMTEGDRIWPTMVEFGKN